MATRNVLNLDALIPDDHFVLLDGVEHKVTPPTVDMYLQIMKARQRMKNVDPDLEGMEQSVMLIRMACESIPEERLRRLPLPALTALADLIQNQMENVDDSGEGTAEGVTESGE